MRRVTDGAKRVMESAICLASSYVQLLRTSAQLYSWRCLPLFVVQGHSVKIWETSEVNRCARKQRMNRTSPHRASYGRIGLAAVTQEVFTLARAIPVARLALAARLLDDTGQGRRTPGQGVCPSGLRLMIAAWSGATHVSVVSQPDILAPPFDPQGLVALERLSFPNPELSTRTQAVYHTASVRSPWVWHVCMAPERRCPSTSVKSGYDSLDTNRAWAGSGHRHWPAHPSHYPLADHARDHLADRNGCVARLRGHPDISPGLQQLSKDFVKHGWIPAEQAK